jgi:hypothetical protein
MLTMAAPDGTVEVALAEAAVAVTKVTAPLMSKKTGKLVPSLSSLFVI